MLGLEDEVKANFSHFKTKWQDELKIVQSSLASNEGVFLGSYTRLTTMNSWRELLIENEVSEKAYDFFCEAQNDGLLSHVLAGLGSWRSALKCLRSCIENVLFCEYYKDHPIELRQWLNGQHRLGFSELVNYFQKHPDLGGRPQELTGLERLQKEYTILSRAVHASDANLRMTVPGGVTNLWSSDSRRLSSWNTRERQTMTGVNLILLCLHYKRLQGASLPGLRQSIALTITTTTLKNKISTKLGVNLNAAT